MKRKRTHSLGAAVLLIFYLVWGFPAAAEDGNAPAVSMETVEKRVLEIMDDENIPGVSIAVIKKGEAPLIKTYGYADLEKEIAVTPRTLFELGSLSKAYTALAALVLEERGLLDLDAPVSKYLDWFYLTYNGRKQPVTLRQLLHHTSGLPWKSMARIPESDSPDALQQTVRAISGMELQSAPGEEYEYATVNYDIIGAVIEAVTGMHYEDYMEKHVFQPLGLTRTRVGTPKEDPSMAVGYKEGIFSVRAYDAPVYRGNNPAGYIAADIRDMARWLRIQLGLTDNPLAAVIAESQQPDMSVPPNTMTLTSYAMGWMVYNYGSPLVEHGGLNPNFTAHIAMRPEENVGVAVLTNSRNNFAAHIAHVVLEHVRGRPLPKPFEPGRTIGGITRIISIGLVFYLLGVLAFIGYILKDVILCKRLIQRPDTAKLLRMGLVFISLIPFALGIYFLPSAMRSLPWKVAVVWSPDTFPVAAFLALAAMAGTYISFVLSSIFPFRSLYHRSAPMIVLLSILSGGANAVVIFLITGALFSKMALKYQVFYYLLAFFVYIMGRKVVQTRLTELSFEIIYDLRVRLLRRVFLSSYQRFEKLERGRVYAVLNDDTHQIAPVANVISGLVTGLITSLFAFVYLFTIAFWATVVTLGVVASIAVFYSFSTAKARTLFEASRDTRNDYMGLLNGLLDGFKELSIRYNKRRGYNKELGAVSRAFSDTTSHANVTLINAFMVGESLLLVVLGAVSFAIPRLFPDITTFTLMSFIMVLLYLIGPINNILNTIPVLTQIRVAWGRVLKFEQEIPANIDPGEIPTISPQTHQIERLTARGVTFSYKKADGSEGFTVGPIDFEARKGEITFIIGGNGSGKTTLAKLLTGLYSPDEGHVYIDGKDIDNQYPGEYFSTVFTGFHLFNKLYDVDMSKKRQEAEKYIKLLQLQDKVKIEGNSFSTTDLSGGQKKRLALLQCYLEDSPIYLFDEVAADQDPEFRRFFYRELLMRMKEEGKIVIAITHDDHYFDVADRIVKMDMGKFDTLEAGTVIRVTQ
jgi:cyclic peptide transporter